MMNIPCDIWKKNVSYVSYIISDVAQKNDWVNNSRWHFFSFEILWTRNLQRVSGRLPVPVIDSCYKFCVYTFRSLVSHQSLVKAFTRYLCLDICIVSLILIYNSQIKWVKIYLDIRRQSPNCLGRSYFWLPL